VPLFLGEWGAIRASFDEDRGGLRWVSDMLESMGARELSFTSHAYHEDGFGLYRGAGALPDPARANAVLIDLFTKTLARSRRRAARRLQLLNHANVIALEAGGEGGVRRVAAVLAAERQVQDHVL